MDCLESQPIRLILMCRQWVFALLVLRPHRPVVWGQGPGVGDRHMWGPQSPHTALVPVANLLHVLKTEAKIIAAVLYVILGFLGGSRGKNPPAHAGDVRDTV